MSIKYRVIQRFNPAKPNDPRKHYASLVTRGDLTLRDVAKELALISTVSIADVTATVEALLEIIPCHLVQGEIVRLGEFGTFSVTLSSDGAPTAEDFGSSLIKGLRLNFRPGKELKQMLAAARFEKE